MVSSIVLTSNCQTAGVASALKQLFPDTTVYGIHIREFATQRGLDARLPVVAEADYWISSEGFPGPKEEPGRGPKRIAFPSIAFHGFHPDLTYLLRTDGGPTITPNYHSRIVAWGYLHGLSEQAVRGLFNRAMFAKLGYFKIWDQNKASIKNRFDECGMNFNLFFGHVQRHGVFMHTINHPKTVVLDQIARMIAVKMTGDRSFMERALHTEDTLGGSTWPVYPEIGDYFALASEYRWISKGAVVSDSLEHCIARFYKLYAEQQLSPDNCAIRRLVPSMDAAFRAEVER